VKRALALGLLALAAACHSGPSIDSFTADKASISSGDAVTFSWKVSGATRLSLDPDVGDVTGTTSAQAHPFATGEYTLTATSGSDSSKARVNITVKPAPGTATFVASPPQAAPGDPVTLSWSIAGATSVSITGLGTQPASGSAVVTPSQTTRYTLTPAGAAPIDLLVRVASKPVITSFVAPPTAQQGSDVTLTWTATNATRFTLTSDAGLSLFLGPLTSATVQPTQTTTYTLTATGPTGSATQAAPVAVVATPGSSFLYTPPAAGAEVARLLADPCPSPCTQLALSLVAAQTVTADALALDLPVPGAARVALHQNAGAPDWQVNPNGDALDPGTAPPAAALALPSSGPLARVLTLGIAQKRAGSGAVATPKQLQPGAVLARFKLDLVPAGGTGLVFSPMQSQAPSFLLRAAGAPQGSLAIGTLRVQ
jgi:hypothetical protein